MIITTSRLAKLIGISYTTLCLFVDRHNLSLPDKEISTVKITDEFVESYKQFLGYKRLNIDSLEILEGLNK